MDESKEPSIPESRQALAWLLQQTADVIIVEQAAQILGVSQVQASKMLSRWTSQGWLRRVAQGAYIAATLDTLSQAVVLDDPWVLVPALFSPAYIGGRSAAEYWDLTEQLFNDTVVYSGKAVRKTSQVLQGSEFTIRHINSRLIFGTRSVWRHSTKVQVSDPHRTILDMLSDPAFAGGIQHVEDCLLAYLTLAERNDQRIIEYGDQLGNGAIFKRLGFLLEGKAHTNRLVEACAARLTKGHSKLDPLIKPAQGKLVKRWRLVIPKSWKYHG